MPLPKHKTVQSFHVFKLKINNGYQLFIYRNISDVKVAYCNDIKKEIMQFYCVDHLFYFCSSGSRKHGEDLTYGYMYLQVYILLYLQINSAFYICISL